MSFNAAFIIPTSVYNGKTRYYFGKEKNGELSSFGGKRDKNESIQKCAIRELNEESLGVFSKDKNIKKKLADQKKYHVHKFDKVLPHTACVTYIVPVSPKKNPIRQFQVERKAKHLKNRQKEMTEVVSVTAQEILSEVKQHPHNMSFKGHTCRGILAWTLKRAVFQGVIK